jgi:beta-hydroxylase
MERLIGATRDGKRTFFAEKDFPWVRDVEEGWRDVRAELDSLLRHRERIPNFQDVSEDQRLLTEGEDWKSFFFYAYGHRAVENCERCPKTDAVLQRIPEMKTAMFSILAPGKHVPPHRGPYKGVLRYHLGLVVPQPSTSCRIRVGDDERSWEEGSSLIFDDTHEHEVWNDSALTRVILFVDFMRPLPFPLSLANRAVVWRISRTPFITDAIDRVRAAEPPPAGD